jgi:hypothetical protein
MALVRAPWEAAMGACRRGREGGGKGRGERQGARLWRGRQGGAPGGCCWGLVPAAPREEESRKEKKEKKRRRGGKKENEK